MAEREAQDGAGDDSHGAGSIAGSGAMQVPSSFRRRRFAALAFATLLLPASPILAGVASPDQRPITEPRTIASERNAQAGPIGIGELFYARTVSGGTWSPDGKEIAFTTNLTGRLNLWKVASSGGWPIQLTQSDERQSGAAWSPAGDWILFEQDRAGNEYADIHALPANGGTPVNLTRTPDISETFPLWSRDATQVAMAVKTKSEPSANVAVMDWKTRQLRRLTTEQDSSRTWSPVAWSRDGRHLYAQRFNIGRTDGDVYRIDVTTGRAENLTPHSGQINYVLADASPDDTTLLLNSDEKGGYRNVALLDLATRKLTWVTDLKWEAVAGDFSPDGRHFTYSVNEDGRTALYLADRATLRAEKLGFPTGVSAFAGRGAAFSPDGGRLLVSHQSSQRLADFWVYDRGRGAARQLTFSALAGLDPRRIPPSHLVHYRSFDGQIISAFLWVPFNLQRDGSHPGVVLPHGGPTGQTTDTFNRTVAALASRGYVVIAPNFRGSTGYGMAFQKANHKDLGGGDLEDVVHAADFLIATGYVDPKRVGITGGSYGGFMTLMAIGKRPERWAAAVEVYGIINWFTMYERQDPWLQQYQRSLIGDPVADRDVYERCSPLTHIHKATAPLLVLHGDNDIRVPKHEAVQVVSILKTAGKTVEAQYYANEGHGFAKRENQIDAIERTLDWFERHLKPARAGQ